MVNLDDGAPEVQAWDHERIRLEAEAEIAIRHLMQHMGSEQFSFPAGHGYILVRKVTGQSGGVSANPHVAPSDVPTSPTPLAPS